ncbi:hypothetical protein DFH09DRAFT_1078457 [Mycena vulgaris]|nr:hypothetical protein DFH09DRAFT_1078457 [Mycena vulgaris]
MLSGSTFGDEMHIEEGGMRAGLRTSRADVGVRWAFSISHLLACCDGTWAKARTCVRREKASTWLWEKLGECGKCNPQGVFAPHGGDCLLQRPSVPAVQASAGWCGSWRGAAYWVRIGVQGGFWKAREEGIRREDVGGKKHKRVWLARPTSGLDTKRR